MQVELESSITILSVPSINGNNVNRNLQQAHCVIIVVAMIESTTHLSMAIAHVAKMEDGGGAKQ
jgi:hypothetical protein